MWYPYPKKMRQACVKILLLSLLGILVDFSQSAPASAALITDVRFWSAPDYTRVVLDLTESIQYESSSQVNPAQLHLEMKETILLTKKRELGVNDSFLSKISLTPFGEKKVAIDPGHGGEDPGAIGPQRTMEKNVVLRVGEKLVYSLNEGNECKAFLTRKRDYFIPLEDRSKIAREYGAELFVSLHADGSFNPQARGSSIYCLSLSGATDEAAKILADKENMSNVLGGAVLRPASIAKDPNLNQILLDLMQNNSMRESFRFADLFLENIKAVNHLKYSHYRQANFIVLKDPGI